MFYQQNGRHGGYRRQFFPAFSEILGGAFFTCGKIVFWRTKNMTKKHPLHSGRAHKKKVSDSCGNPLKYSAD